MKTFTIALFACLLISCPIVVHGGTAHLVADLMSGATSDSNPASFTRFGDKLLFIATNGAEGRELWITDGTLAGTHLVKDIAPGIRSAFPLAYNSTSIPAAIGVSGSLAHFWANDSPIQLQGG
ncbi:MAG TPA: hypothetical protein VEZ11_12905, partial [Thermoanaerobaculia bacterium]|nr:hypothetical protein [Thermoanaerobaculia bacterium]